MDVILHIGRQKTGSTSIQMGLAAIRRQLARRDILYPASLGGYKSKYLRDFFESGRRLEGRIEQVGGAFERELSRSSLTSGLLGQKRSWRQLILSNENLCESNPEMLGALKRFITERGGRARIFCYVRRPDEHVVSLFQQRIRTGGLTEPLEEFMQRSLRQDYYAYASQMEPWAEAFGKEAVHVRLFHRSVLKQDPFYDFLGWVGIAPDGLSIPPMTLRNESYDPLSAAVLRYLRRYLVESPGEFDEDLFYSFRRELRMLNTQERLRLTHDQAMMVWEESRSECERLARDYLSEKEAALLLTPPAATPPAPPVELDAVIGRTLDVLARCGRFAGIRVKTAEEAVPDNGPVAARLRLAIERYRAERPSGGGAVARALHARLAAREDFPSPIEAAKTQDGRAVPAEPTGDPYVPFAHLIGMLASVPFWIRLRQTVRTLLGRSLKTPKARSRESKRRRRHRQRVRAGDAG